jgi:opine dehydrogenase
VEATKGDFLFYIEGATPSVCKVIEEIDSERIAVEKAFGFKPYTAQEWIKKVYGSKGDSLYEVLQNTIPYHDRACESAPSSLTYRYVTEDVLFGLIPLSSFGALLNIPTPTAKTLTHMASLLNKRDYLSEGLNVEKMGLSGKTVDQIIEMIS